MSSEDILKIQNENAMLREKLVIIDKQNPGLLKFVEQQSKRMKLSEKLGNDSTMIQNDHNMMNKKCYRGLNKNGKFVFLLSKILYRKYIFVLF